jgi:thiol-disulfide isomerase/thioredoxin
MKKLRTFFLLLAFCSIYLNSSAQGYEIKIKIPKLPNQQIILGHRFNTQLFPDDTTMLNNKGEGVFKGKTKLPGGMYFIFLPSRNLYDILISDDQNLSIESDTSNFYKTIKVSDKQNQQFIEYSLYLEKPRELANTLSKEYQESKDEKRKAEIEKKLVEINKEVAKKMDELIAANPNTFLAAFVKINKEIVVPESITDQKDKFYYYRNQYLKQFDFKDARLLRTPLYEDKINFYVDKLLPQVPDSLIQHVDYLIENSHHSKELFRYMLVSLFNKFATSQIMGMENVYVHIAEKYYIPEAEWADKKFIDELKEKVRRKKQALVGMKAPEIKMILVPKGKDAIEDIRSALDEMKTAGNAVIKDEAKLKEKAKIHKTSNPKLSDSAAYSRVVISDLAEKLETIFLPKFDGYISMQEHQSKYLILYFWEPDCSHCKEATPKFSAAYDEKKFKDLGVDVMSVYLHRNINEWEKYTKHIGEWFDFMEKNNMQKWVNVWEPFGYSQFRDKYDISSSPVLYLLDKDKNILAKNIGWEQAFEYIEHLEKVEKENK